MLIVKTSSVNTEGVNSVHWSLLFRWHMLDVYSVQVLSHQRWCSPGLQLRLWQDNYSPRDSSIWSFQWTLSRSYTNWGGTAGASWARITWEKLKTYTIPFSRHNFHPRTWKGSQRIDGDGERRVTRIRDMHNSILQIPVNKSTYRYLFGIPLKCLPILIKASCELPNKSETAPECSLPTSASSSYGLFHFSVAFCHVITRSLISTAYLSESRFHGLLFNSASFWGKQRVRDD